MKAETFMKKLGVGLSSATLVIALSACAHHPTTAGDNYGNVRTEAAAQNNTGSDQAIGTAPAPSNAQGVTDKAGPAVISGPAKVDSSGRAYTSSSTGGSGNASSTGLNTNVNIIPPKSSSTVSVTESVVTPPPPPPPAVVVETPAPAPTYTPAPTVTETTTETTSMASSSTDDDKATTTKSTKRHHRRLHKD
jgi:hypothetical protein